MAALTISYIFFKKSIICKCAYLPQTCPISKLYSELLIFKLLYEYFVQKKLFGNCYRDEEGIRRKEELC